MDSNPFESFNATNNGANPFGGGGVSQVADSFSKLDPFGQSQSQVGAGSGGDPFSSSAPPQTQAQTQDPFALQQPSQKPPPPPAPHQSSGNWNMPPQNNVGMSSSDPFGQPQQPRPAPLANQFGTSAYGTAQSNSNPSSDPFGLPNLQTPFGGADQPSGPLSPGNKPAHLNQFFTTPLSPSHQQGNSTQNFGNTPPSGPLSPGNQPGGSGHFFSNTNQTNDPFGPTSPSFGSASQADTGFGTNNNNGADPFGTSGASQQSASDSADPFGTTGGISFAAAGQTSFQTAPAVQGSDPFGVSAGFNQHSQTSSGGFNVSGLDPFGAPPAAAAPPADPFGTAPPAAAAPPADPFGTAPETHPQPQWGGEQHSSADPFGQSDPFGAGGSSGFGQDIFGTAPPQATSGFSNHASDDFFGSQQTQPQFNTASAGDGGFGAEFASFEGTAQGSLFQDDGFNFGAFENAGDFASKPTPLPQDGSRSKIGRKRSSKKKKNAPPPSDDGFSASDDNYSASDDDFSGDEGLGELELQREDNPRQYEVVFHEQKLGMLLERKDLWTPGNEQRTETTTVKMVVEGQAASEKRVTVGSKLLSINGRKCNSITYQETLNLVKTLPRPITIVLESPQDTEDDTTQGYCLYKASIQGAPRNMENWKRRYYVVGGAVARPNVLQIYTSKADYEKVVVSMFQQKRVAQKVKAWKLTKKFKCSNIKTKSYRSRTVPIKYFSIKSPQSRMKHICFAAENMSGIQALYTHTKRFCS